MRKRNYAIGRVVSQPVEEARVLFDTHLHLIYLDRLAYPWLDDFASLKQDATYVDYDRMARRVGIMGALHMEVDVADEDREAETDLIAELMAEPDCVLHGAISSCRPEQADFEPFLERQLQRSEVKGFRRVLHVVPDDLSQSRLFRDNVKRLSGTGMTFDLCVLPRQIPIANALVDHCPNVQFVLDHCGVPDVKGQALTPWSGYISDMARRPNVVAKISGVVAYGDPDGWTLNDIRPFVEHTIDCFGWQRVVWGSDSPVCTLGGNLETWVAATHALLEHCSADEKAALSHRNAERLWKLPTSN